MLPIALVIATGFLVFFFWSVRNGDHMDPERPKYTMLLDDENDVDRTWIDKSKK